MDKDGQKKKERYKLGKVEVRLKLTKNGGLYSTEPINSPSAAVKVMAKAMAQLDREYVCVVNLNSQTQPINYNIVSIGTLDSAAASRANIFKSAILSNASSIILLHCHPSGSLKPSMDDAKLTISLIQAGKLMDIKVLDHIIVAGGSGKTFSFREKTGLFNQEYAVVAEDFAREGSKLNMGKIQTDGIREDVIFHVKEDSMDFKEFRDEIKQLLAEKMESGTSIEDTDVKKLQGESYQGIIVRPEDSIIGVTISIEDAYKAVESGSKTVDEVAGEIVKRLEAAFEDRPANIDINALASYEAMKDKLFLEVVNTDMNKEMLADVPHKEIEDLSVVCRFDVDRDNGATILITNNMLERYNISEEQLFADAEANAPDIAPVVISGLGDVISELTGSDMPDVTPSVLVATNDRKCMGAAVIDYPGFMDDVADKVGGDFFVLPSSIHELLIIKDDGAQNFRDLETMVHEVNATVVDSSDRLSDNVYHFDNDNKIFELASKHNERENSKEKDSKSKEKRNSVLGDLDEKKDACRAEVRFAETSKKYQGQEL